MENADNIIVMGHNQEDYDAIGATVGIAALARFLKKPIHIAVGNYTKDMRQCKKILGDNEEDGYLNDLIVIGKDAVLDLVCPNTLLILVDHHREQLSSVPELLDKVEHKIIIDHHRRSEDIITDTTLLYQEPTSSSTSEMITELFPYFDEDLELTRLEASYLYAGIFLDSKKFTVQTSERTFDVAAYLKSSGVEQNKINRLFADTLEDSQIRAKLLVDTKIIAPGFAVTINKDAEKTQHNNILASQTADQLITILDVNGACAINAYKDGSIGINARSDGTKFNVQIMMEALGGGGHQNVAACQLTNKTVDEVINLLQEEIKKQMEE
ncbi:MAG: DHH family phosphoesterase [Acidaminococcaceae bacterium]|nr:DHH family phosphoesterase [Acidaminococcaceae bacterium]